MGSTQQQGGLWFDHSSLEARWNATSPSIHSLEPPKESRVHLQVGGGKDVLQESDHQLLIMTAAGLPSLANNFWIIETNKNNMADRLIETNHNN
mmetsp:Transcript_35451/g.85947  ORF Transcript_35451/g.85947 Transcript_35451/m.85947 type:complete len:94 (-) Transcript_35451:32-313(-)